MFQEKDSMGYVTDYKLWGDRQTEGHRGNIYEEKNINIKICMKGYLLIL